MDEKINEKNPKESESLFTLEDIPKDIIQYSHNKVLIESENPFENEKHDLFYKIPSKYTPAADKENTCKNFDFDKRSLSDNSMNVEIDDNDANLFNNNQVMFDDNNLNKSYEAETYEKHDEKHDNNDKSDKKILDLEKEDLENTQNSNFNFKKLDFELGNKDLTKI